MCQSTNRHARTMLRLSLFIILLTHRIRTAYVTNTPSFADRLDRIYEKLERLTVAPIRATDRTLGVSPEEKLYAKLEKLNSLTPDKFYLTDEDEELLSAMQVWGRLSADQLDVVVKDLQRLKEDHDDERSEKITYQEYGDGEWIDDELSEFTEGEYPMDGKEFWDPEDEQDSSVSTTKPALGVTPSAFTRHEAGYKHVIVSAIDPIAATNERPRILDDSSLTAEDRSALRRAALVNMRRVVEAGKCLVPQPRWLTVRQLAPAADTAYMPPCVQLHRCAPDSGCCNNEAEVCAPVDGKYVAIPFYLHKADGRISVARMQFFNHTQCACVSRETLQSTVRTRIEVNQVTDESQEVKRDFSSEGQNDWRAPPTEEPRLEKDDDVTAPPQLRRCTCPVLFMANLPDNGPCACVCDWPDITRRRDCLSLARGKEHFGLRDRVCVASGDCTPPTCEYGAYDRDNGLCPLRRYRRIRYHGRGRYQPDKAAIV